MNQASSLKGRGRLFSANNGGLSCAGSTRQTWLRDRLKCENIFQSCRDDSLRSVQLSLMHFDLYANIDLCSCRIKVFTSDLVPKDPKEVTITPCFS